MVPGLIRRGAALGSLILGAALLTHGSWIPLKAWLAQQLLQQAWAETLNDGDIHRPWTWADHWPVARLRAPGEGVDLIVLEGDSGNVLAFAPGHAIRSGMPGDSRTLVISGHRDTHFRFLEGLGPGEVLELEAHNGRYRYRVTETGIRDSRDSDIVIRDGVEELILVTCYPFDAPMAGGSLRYLVRAELVRPTVL